MAVVLRILAATAVSVACLGAATAGGRLPDDAYGAVRDKLAAIGCEAGEIEDDGDGFEIENAECPKGVYDIKLDESLEIVELERD